MQTTKEFIAEKVGRFAEFLMSIVKDEHKTKINIVNDSNLLTYYMILRMKEEDKQKNIDELIQKLEIDAIHKPKIEDFYDCFLDIKKNMLP